MILQNTVNHQHNSEGYDYHPSNIMKSILTPVNIVQKTFNLLNKRNSSIVLN